MRVLVIGATGKNAGLVVPELLGRGVDVLALVRDESRAASARQRGVREIVVGDLRDQVGLRRAMEGVDGVFHINPAFAPDEADLGVSVVQAAQAAGVGKVVFSSVYHPSSSLSNHAAKRAVEEALFNATLSFVVLQPAMFMQNLAGLVGEAANGRIAFPYSARSRMSYVDYRDVAEAAAIGMTEGRLDGGTFELAAGGTTDTVEIAALFSAALGRPVEGGQSDPAVTLASMPEGPCATASDGCSASTTATVSRGAIPSSWRPSWAARLGALPASCRRSPRHTSGGRLRLKRGSCCRITGGMASSSPTGRGVFLPGMDDA